MFLMQRLFNNVGRANTVNNLCSAFRTLSVSPSMLQQQQQQVQVENQVAVEKKEVGEEEKKNSLEVFNNINNQLMAREEGRMFAVVHLCGKQFKITAGDIIVVEGYWPPTIGDQIRLDKVLLAGAKDFTLIGRPILDEGLVNVYATIIEKSLSHTRTHFKKKRRKQYTRINFQRTPNTMIRINSIDVGRKVDASLTDINKDRLF